MQWALVNTTTVQLEITVITSTPSIFDPTKNVDVFSQEIISAIPGTICNLIAYDGVSPYTPADNYKLVQVPDSAKIGDTGY